MKSAVSLERLTLSGEIKLRQEDLQVSAREGLVERRKKPRIANPFPTRVWGADATGNTFEIDCTLDNVSSQGLYLRLPRRIASGAELNVVIKFSDGLHPGATALLVCEALREEPQTDGLFGLAMRVKNYHFI